MVDEVGNTEGIPHLNQPSPRVESNTRAFSAMREGRSGRVPFSGSNKWLKGSGLSSGA